jgi:hypothetical protein
MPKPIGSAGKNAETIRGAARSVAAKTTDSHGGGKFARGRAEKIVRKFQ